MVAAGSAPGGLVFFVAESQQPLCQFAAGVNQFVHGVFDIVIGERDRF